MNEYITELVNTECSRCHRHWKQPKGTDPKTFVCDACELDDFEGQEVQ